jgi:hypothetical protein
MIAARSIIQPLRPKSGGWAANQRRKAAAFTAGTQWKMFA